ncbi:hypothetical protein KY343_00395 [Candidatus Woesearchaeota archaeon]|nr:hypothetical protein [Candidatus Woesearchaeota archaeon]
METNKLREIAKEIAEREWYIVIERPLSPVLDWDGSVSNVNDYLSKTLRTPFFLDGFVFFQNKLMKDMKEHKRTNEFILNKYRTDKYYIKDLAMRMENECNDFIEFTKKLDKKDLNSIKKFFNVFNEGIITHFRWIYNAAEVFEKIVKEAVEKPLKKNYITKYNIALDEIRKKIKNKNIDLDNIKEDKEAMDLINKFLKDFAWIKIFHHQGDFLDFDMFIEELKNSIDLKLKKDEDTNLNEDVELLRYTIFLRTHVAESNAYAGAIMKPTFELLAKRFGLEYDDITFLRQKEIIEMIDTNKLSVTKEEINQRKKGFACINLKRRYYFIYGSDLQRLYYFYDYFSKDKKKNKEEKVLRGTCANQGYVRGIAKIVVNIEEFNKFQKGDILIANSTTPNYVPIMGKASAFLTDEGGITSHAAIVSREMGKPCITGLKNATKILKDGDLIEVDATKGIVRKLE